MKTWSWMVGVTGLCLLLGGCGESKEGGGDKDKKADGDKDEEPEEKGPFKAKKFKLGKVEFGDKCDDTYPIDKNDAGEVTACALKADADVVVGDITCKGRGRPYAHDDGTLSNCGVKGVVEIGPFKCHKGLHFHKGGMPKDCYLKEPGTADGKECKTKVSFKEDGTIRDCK